MKKCSAICWIAVILMIVGGLNYGLMGFFNYNLLDMLFGTGLVTRVVYALIGVSAVVTIFGLKKCCKSCKVTDTPK